MSELNLSEAVLRRRVWHEGIYRQHSTQYMLGQTRRYIRLDQNVVDVGAAVGMYSYFWATTPGFQEKVFSFEAVEPVFQQLQKTATRVDNMKVFNLAVSDHQGTATFYVDTRRLSNSSFHPLEGIEQQEITVDAVQLDQLDLGPVGFLKVDVEGEELNVLKGAENHIKAGWPTIMCEIYPRFNDGPVADTFQWLFDRGYTAFYNRRAEGLAPVRSLQHGVDVASDPKMLSVHDGDFLFVHGSST